MAGEVFNHKFTWKGGGGKVFLRLRDGFNRWQEKPMTKSRDQPGVFSTTVQVFRGRHEFMFIVDGQYVLDSEKEKATNAAAGFISNICWIPVEETTGDHPPDHTELPVSDDEATDDGSESDTESVSSTSSSVISTPADAISTAKLRVQCPQAPLLVKHQLEQHLISTGYRDNIVSIQWKAYGKGHSIVSLTPAHTASSAISLLNGSLLCGKYKLEVKQDRKKRSRDARGRKGKQVDKKKAGDETQVFVGSFPKTITNVQLREHFHAYQKHITDVIILKDKGCGFVWFSSRFIAGNAIEALNGTLLLSKHKIKVNWAKKSTKAAVEDSSDTSEFCVVYVNSKPQLIDTVSNKQLQEHFSQHLEDLVSIKVIRDFQTKKGYGIATFRSQIAAQQAVDSLNNSMLLGQYKLNLHIKSTSSETRKISTNQTGANVHQHVREMNTKGTCPPLLPDPLHSKHASSETKRISTKQFSNARANVHQDLRGNQQPHILKEVSDSPIPLSNAEMGFTVSVVNLNPLIEETEVQALIGGNILGFEQTASSRVIRFGTYEAAKAAVESLNGKSFLGETVLAYINPTNSPQVNPPNIFDRPEHVQRQGSINHPGVSKADPFPPHRPHDARLVHSHDRQLLLKLTSYDWNRLMKVEPGRISLFQELFNPYKTNLSIEILRNEENLSIRFTGLREAVESAYEHFWKEVIKEIPIQDRLRLSSLSYLRPDLPVVFKQKYGITLTGFTEELAAIRLEGNSDNFLAARQEFEGLMNRMYLAKVNHVMPQKLLNSVKAKFRSDRTRVCVYRNNSVLTVHSLDQSHLKEAMRVLEVGPLTYSVSVGSEDAAEKLLLIGLENGSDSVHVEKNQSTIIIKSYVLKDFEAMKESLLSKSDEVLMQEIPLSCSPEECQYILTAIKRDEVKEIVSSLPAECVAMKDTVVLRGSSESISQSQATIHEMILSQLLHRKFTFHCKMEFINQLEQFVLKRAGSRLEWVVNSSGSQQRPSSGKEESEKCLIIYSKNPSLFNQICSSLEDVEPCSIKHQLPRGAVESIGLNEIQQKLAHTFRVKISHSLRPKESAIVIHGITSNEVNSCWSEINQLIQEKHEITKHIPFLKQQKSFLEKNRSQELAKLKKDCTEFHFLFPRNETEVYQLRIKGTVQKVDSVSERISEVLSTLSMVEDKVECEIKFTWMWKKWWDRIGKEQERISDLIIEIEEVKALPIKAESRSSVTFNFSIVGTNKSEIDVVRTMIAQRDTATKTLELSSNAAQSLLKDKKEFLYPLIVHLFINTHSNKAILTAPQDATEDLETAEEEIMKFIGEHTTINKNILSDDEVVGLVLTSRHKSVENISKANSIARRHGVKVYPLKKPQIGLRVCGTTEAIKAVEPLIISQVLDPISQTVKKLDIKVSSIFSLVFTTSSFMHFDSKLQDEFCVSCSYPKTSKMNKLIRKAMIQPSSSALCLKLEIYKGSIIFEQADAIVNAANEDLKHVGGVAKAILDAGGPVIQVESNSYIQVNGKLKQGEVVLLSPGKLPCKAIIHAVGPRWREGKLDEEASLYLTVLKCLETASKEDYGSIALPAISTGIFSVPENICAKVSLKAVRDFCTSYPESTLHTIRFVLYKESELKEFCSLFDSDVILEISLSHVRETSSELTASTNDRWYTWFWANDHGTFTPYSNEDSKRFTHAYSQNPNGTIMLSSNGNRYLIDFGTMNQTNTASNHKRSIKYDINPSTQLSDCVQWCYMDDRSNFTPYNLSHSQAVEKMYQSKTPGCLQIGVSTYTFDFVSMCQINHKTNYKRNIQRQESSSPSSPYSPRLSVSSMLDEPAVVDSETRSDDLLITMRGPFDTLPLAKDKLEQKLKSYINTESIPIKFSLPLDFSEKLRSIALNHNVTLSVKSSSTSPTTQNVQSVITLEGIDQDIQIVLKSVQQQIIDYQVSVSKSVNSESKPPPEWQPQSRTTEVFMVAMGCSEWNGVKQKFRSTLPSSNIIGISRIQNSWLWDKYCNHKRRLNLKNDGKVNEMELFHGTRGNDPKLVYEGEDGFDMRYSNQGLWGQANYFAVNASYSNGYSYQAHGGIKEMFLVKVLTGDSYACPSNSSLRLPPVKPNSTGSKVQFNQIRYDTVTGSTGGSKVFMTYDNDKAYPAYLIKYS